MANAFKIVHYIQISWLPFWHSELHCAWRTRTCSVDQSSRSNFVRDRECMWHVDGFAKSTQGRDEHMHAKEGLVSVISLWLYHKMFTLGWRNIARVSRAIGNNGDNTARHIQVSIPTWAERDRRQSSDPHLPTPSTRRPTCTTLGPKRGGENCCLSKSLL